MITYLLKSGLCLGLIYLSYRCILEQEKMPTFNRFFLLIGLIFSFSVPLIDIEYTSILVESPLLPLTTLNPLPFVKEEASSSQFSWALGFYLIYGLITSFLLIRIIYHLNNLRTTIRTHQTITYKTAKLVLLKHQPLPYTFLNYIFVDTSAHQNGLIEQELYTHEFAHAHQLHSIDILIIEFLQALFWFNPLLYFYKKSIQLNHEFLADQKVINTHHKIADYQHLLLDKITSNQQRSLTSNLNFLLTKKRLKMMTKNTSKFRACSLAAINFSLFCCLLFLFSNPVAAQKKGHNKPSPKEEQKIKDAYFKHTTFAYDTDPIIYKLYSDLSEKAKKKLQLPLKKNAKPLPKGMVAYLNKNGLVKYFSDSSMPPPPPPPPPAAPVPPVPPAAPADFVPEAPPTPIQEPTPIPLPEPTPTPVPEPSPEPVPSPR